MRHFILLFAFLVSTVSRAQEDGTVLKPVPDLGGTTFKDMADATTFLKGLMDAEADGYGNVSVYKDGSWGQRMSFRLTDVKLVAKVFTTPMEYYGAEVGPRVQIVAQCSSGPCIKDPLGPDTPPMDSKSFFVPDVAKGKQVYATLLIMQGLLKK